jgi:hypothetical protein
MVMSSHQIAKRSAGARFVNVTPAANAALVCDGATIVVVVEVDEHQLDDVASKISVL